MTASERAPAKVNLYLHVGPPTADGFHSLSSLMVFADVCDELTFAPGGAFRLRLEGPFAAGLGAEADNLAVRAILAFCEETGVSPPEGEFVLRKEIPSAAGLGGGSSDAGAALKLVRRLCAPDIADGRLEAIAARLGSDGAACFRVRPVIAEGRGERLSDVVGFPVLDAVLVNPRTPCPTGPVFRQYDASGAPGSDGRADPPKSLSGPRAAIDWLKTCRNDLEAPAVAVAPVIADALSSLNADPACRLARVTGSGATCFAICDDASVAAGLASRLSSAHADWWVRACRLG